MELAAARIGILAAEDIAPLRESVEVSQAIGAQGLLAESREGLTWLAAIPGQPGRAARLGGAAEALRAAPGMALHPVLCAGHEQAVQPMRAVLGEEGLAAVWAEGAAMSPEPAITGA
jgi:hypothetical protein